MDRSLLFFLTFFVSLAVNAAIVWNEGRGVRESVSKTLAYIVVSLTASVGFVVGIAYLTGAF